jgi:hypothetical protein
VKPDYGHRAAFWRSVLTAHARSQDDAFEPCWDKSPFGWVDGTSKLQTDAEIEHRNGMIQGLNRVFAAGSNLEIDLTVAAGSKESQVVHFDVLAYMHTSMQTAAPVPTNTSRHAKIYTVFHATQDLESAKDIIENGFASLDHENKWYGAGYYFSTSLEYVCEKYGKDDSGAMTIIMARVIIGAPFPVLEGPDSAQSLSGQSCMPRHDAHIVTVDKGDNLPYGIEENPASKENRKRKKQDENFDGGVPFSEIVIFNPHNILPTAILRIG